MVAIAIVICKKPQIFVKKSIVLCFTRVLDFPAHPPLPPSRIQLIERNKGKFSNSEFFDSLKQLAKNKGFIIHSIAFGINVAVFSAISTLLNQFILFYFPVSFSKRD